MKKLLVSLLMVVGLAIVARQARIESPLIQQLSITLALGVLMLGAWLTGRIFDAIRLPKISGYLLFGLLVGPSVWSMIPLDGLGAVGRFLKAGLPLVSPDEIKQLRFASDLAIAVIALTAGGEIKFSWLRDRLWRLVVLIGTDVMIMLPLGLAATWLGARWIPYLNDADAMAVLVVGVVTGTIMIGNSPAVIIAMISDLRSDGPLTQTALAMTICKDLLLVVLFATAMAWGTTVLDPQRQLSPQFLVSVAAQIFGSFVVGGVMGLAMAL
jgi:Kef-type K+ transport system membrane component KefB